MEKFMYPALYMRITQGYMMGSHKSSYAIDDGCSDSAIDYVVAPYSGVVKTIYSQYENEVFFESDNQVLFADGTQDYATTMFVHQNSPMAYGMAVGKHYNQGDKIYLEGGRYAGKNGVFANHVHMEFAKGKNQGWYKNPSGIYSLRNAKKPEECCFISDDYHILYNYGYKFRNIKELDTKQYVNLPGNIDSWAVYDINVSPVKKNAKGKLNPMKFGGLSYYVYEYRDNGTTAVINTSSYGKVKIYIKGTPAVITTGSHTYNRGDF